MTSVSILSFLGTMNAFRLNEYLYYQLSPFPPASLRPGTFFEKRTDLSLLRQFEIMQETMRPSISKQSHEHKVYNINLLKQTLGDVVCNE